jgi:hypothetical protein
MIYIYIYIYICVWTACAMYDNLLVQRLYGLASIRRLWLSHELKVPPRTCVTESQVDLRHGVNHRSAC